MAGRRYSKRRRSFRRRTRRKVRSVRRIARRALRVAKFAAKTELKYNQSEIAGFYPGRQILDHYFEPFANISRGVNDFAERVGDQIYAKRLHIAGSITLPDQIGITLNNVTNRQNFVRLWVAVIPQPAVYNAASKAQQVTKIFDLNDFQWLAPFSLKNWDDRVNSRLLYSKVYKINTYQPQVKFHVKVRLHLPIQYNTDGQIIHNQVYYGFMSDNTTGLAGGTYAYVHHFSRVTYSDA